MGFFKAKKVDTSLLFGQNCTSAQIFEKVDTSLLFGVNCTSNCDFYKSQGEGARRCAQSGIS